MGMGLQPNAIEDTPASPDAASGRQPWHGDYLFLLGNLMQKDFKVRYRNMSLGVFWSLLNPLAMTVILCVAFHEIFHIPVRQYAPILLTGLACWNYLTTVVLQGCDCLFHGEKYIRQYPVPIAVYPLRTALAAALAEMISEGEVNEAQALQLAHGYLHDNAVGIYRGKAR